MDLNQPYIIGGAIVGAILFITLILILVSSRRKRAAALKLQTPADSQKDLRVESPPAEMPRTLWSMLARTQEAFAAKLDALVLGEKKIDESFLENLEELLYTSDLGPKTVSRLLVAVREKLSRGELQDLHAVKKALYVEILKIMAVAEGRTHFFGKEKSAGDGYESAPPKPWVILVVGVNGVGKTTSIGKLAQYYASRSKKVLVVAGDTFRAAAGAQLAVWGERANVEVYSSEQTSDAAAVAYQGIQRGIAEGHDVVIVDTAGRLHTKENLMEELRKVKRVCAKALPTSPHEIVLVIDANSGQNAKVQAQQFNEALGLTSLIVTKLDGTARGGIIVSIAEEVGIGVQFIGTGEKLNDLQSFSTDEYAKGLLRL